MSNELLQEFVRLDRDVIAQITAADYKSAVHSVARAAEVEAKLKWTLAKQATVTPNAHLKRFIAREFQIQRLISELNLERDGPDGTLEWSDLGWLADEHLNHVLDLEDPDWPDPINARLLKLDILFTKRTLPDWVMRHIRAMRRSYGLAMYDLVWISLRALIEAASYEWLLQNNGVRNNRGVRDYAERSIRECLTRVEARRPISRQQMAQVSRVVDRANLIVHSKRSTDIPDDAATLAATKIVAAYLARLFD